MKVFDLYEFERGARARRACPMSGAAKLRALKSILGSASVILAAGVASAQGNEPAPAPPAPAAAEPPAPAQPTAAPAEPPAASAPPAPAAPEPAAQSPAVEATSRDAPLDPQELEVGSSAASDQSQGGLDEVVVTVDRRRKDLQKVSGTAQAFNEKRLTSVGINGVAGLATMVPGLEIAQEEGNTEVYIRGVGNDNNAEHGDMGVALHLDGVYLPRPRGVGSLFYDIERVEVASGPQGTLRGRNARAARSTS